MTKIIFVTEGRSVLAGRIIRHVASSTVSVPLSLIDDEITSTAPQTGCGSKLKRLPGSGWPAAIQGGSDEDRLVLHDPTSLSTTTMPQYGKREWVFVGQPNGSLVID